MKTPLGSFVSSVKNSSIFSALSRSHLPEVTQWVVPILGIRYSFSGPFFYYTVYFVEDSIQNLSVIQDCVLFWQNTFSLFPSRVSFTFLGPQIRMQTGGRHVNFCLYYKQTPGAEEAKGGLLLLVSSAQPRTCHRAVGLGPTCRCCAGC